MKVRVAVLLLVSGSLVCGMAAQKDGRKADAVQTTNASRPATKTSNRAVAEPDGAKLFQKHCNRCHTAPDELSPRVARTVVQHMRMRGMLPEKDVQAILNYIAPE